jgi:hypothetical protein
MEYADWLRRVRSGSAEAFAFATFLVVVASLIDWGLGLLGEDAFVLAGNLQVSQKDSPTAKAHFKRGDANAPQPIVNLRRVNIIKVVPAPHRISSCLLRQQTECASEFIRVIRRTAECHLLAQSRHPDRVGECPLSGEKRTSKFKSVTSVYGPKRSSRRLPICAAANT